MNMPCIRPRVAALLLGVSGLAAVSSSWACTRLVFHGANGHVITARSMDWKSDIVSNLWVLPRGMQRTGETGHNTVRWTSKYGSVITSGYDISTTDGVNAPTPSFVLAAALSFAREQEQAVRDRGDVIDYKAVMGPDLASFCAAAGLPAAPNALSDAGYMFTLSGADNVLFRRNSVSGAVEAVARARDARVLLRDRGGECRVGALEAPLQIVTRGGDRLQLQAGAIGLCAQTVAAAEAAGIFLWGRAG